ncbi:MAG: Nif3-like dinuclear metal center hexameric protein [Candidatus Abyssobacteria bacterium SURF_17]|uniref:GTP cyclohydrolase 1 type 2 homolog n=1 Tax=Candidatus Abyssobacteria bacterium SURF_17 TaxID=2093361 RepID=A0A419EWV2_9BACT|nr:MAG: Nif3-like dinuclear metal center hexameric protein [Candidatus Abyssubacteria bacterium SURF_17]
MHVTAAVSKIIEAMEQLAPPAMALEGDTIGLQTPCASSIDKVLLSLDVDLRVVDEAKRRGAGLIIAHHPVIYRKLERITGADLTERVLMASIRDEIGIYIAHTNLDCAPGGVNDVLAQRLELQNIRPLEISYTEKKFKVVVFVPEAHVDKVRAAMCEAGAGIIGEYRFCSFQSPGTGTFIPSEQASPFSGAVGALNREPEVRLEVLVPHDALHNVIDAMKGAHPYEEVAHDVYELASAGRGFGMGRIGELPEAVAFKDYVELVKRRLGIKRAKVVGRGQAKIMRVAACGGGGGTLIPAALAERADAFVTGGVNYHQMLSADAMGLCLVEAGHGATERIVLPVLAENLQRKVPGVEVLLSRVKTDRSDWV